MQDNRHFTSQRSSGPFEAKPLPQHQAPSAKSTFRADPGQENGGGLVKERTQLTIARSRDVTVIIDLA